MSKVRVDANGCWVWTGTAYGYGRIRVNRKSRLAHRVSYETFVGPIPEGKYVCHRCDVPLCINPDHLFTGTAMQNSQDMASKGRANPWNRGLTHCERGHEFTPENTGSNTNGGRSCRTCHRAAKMRYKARQKVVA